MERHLPGIDLRVTSSLGNREPWITEYWLFITYSIITIHLLEICNGFPYCYIGCPIELYSNLKDLIKGVKLDMI